MIIIIIKKTTTKKAPGWHSKWEVLLGTSLFIIFCLLACHHNNLVPDTEFTMFKKQKQRKVISILSPDRFLSCLAERLQDRTRYECGLPLGIHVVSMFWIVFCCCLLFKCNVPPTLKGVYD